MLRIFKLFFLVCALLLAGCHDIEDLDLSGFNFLNQKKPVANQPAVLSKDMYLCETLRQDWTVSEKYLTYPGNYFRYSKTLLPATDEYNLHRNYWQNWHVLPKSKSRIITLLPKGTLIEIKNYKQPNQYDELFGAKTESEIVILSGPNKGKTVMVNSTFFRPS